MKKDDAIDHLNTLAAESAKDDKPMRTTEELREFFKNPPKRAYSVPLEEAMTAIVKIFRMADENGRRDYVKTEQARAEQLSGIWSRHGGARR